MDCQQEDRWLEQLEIPHLRMGGVVLIPRTAVVDAIKKGASVGVQAIGLDAFTLYPDGKIQPDMAFDLDPANGTRVEANEAWRHLQNVSDKITHFEIAWEAPNKPMQADAAAPRR